MQWCVSVCLVRVQCVGDCEFECTHIAVQVHILSAHCSAGERGSVSPGRPRGRRRSSDEDGARDVDYRKHKLSKNAMMRTIMTLMAMTATLTTMTVTLRMRRRW